MNPFRLLLFLFFFGAHALMDSVSISNMGDFWTLYSHAQIEPLQLVVNLHCDLNCSGGTRQMDLKDLLQRNRSCKRLWDDYMQE